MALTITQRPLAEVAKTISRKTPLGTALGSGALNKLPAALHNDALVSAKVESVRALAEAQAGLTQILDQVRETRMKGGKEVSLLAMDRSKWIAQAQQSANRLGLRNADPEKRGSLQDYGSERRLKEIYFQQISGAQNKAYYLSGMDPDTLDAWPAQELVRVRASKIPRDWDRRWAAAGGKSFDGRMIALKTDPIWAKISRFGRPWPPFDYNSGMGLEEIDREEAERLGLIAPGETINPTVEADAAAMRETSLAGVSPELRAQMKKEFGDALEIDGDVARWRPHAGKKAPQPKPSPPAPEAKPSATSVADMLPHLTRLDDEIARAKAEIAAANKAGDYAKANEHADRAQRLLEEQREVVSVPEAERRAVKFANKKLPPSIAKTLTAGAAIASRYIHPDLVPQGLTAVSKKGRAFYRSSTRSIHTSPYGSPSTVAHEITHDIEYSHPEVSQATKAFLQKRAGGQAAKPLRDLTGNPNYKWDEIAFEDEWKARGGDHYSGKIYPRAATEILTMGIERLHHNPAEFARLDPEYFSFVVNTLRKW